VFSRPAGRHHTAEDHLALAQWHEAQGRVREAEAAYRAAVRGNLRRPEAQVKAHNRYAALLKRLGRREEAVEQWEAAFTLAPREAGPCIELAKHYEWVARDYASALGWTRVALKAAGHLPKGWQKDELVQQLTRRQQRLEKKGTAARRNRPPQSG
jgi:tetratricopeptide (TPR) repeat protein